MVTSTSSSNASGWKPQNLPLRGDLDEVPLQDPSPPFTSDLVLRRASSPVLAVQLRGDPCVCARRWKRHLWCSRRCCGEVNLGSHPAGRAGTAPPCRLDKRLGAWWVSSSSSSSPSTPLPGHGLQPCWSRPVSQARRACSVMLLLLDVCLTQLGVLVLPMWWTACSSSSTIDTLTDRGVVSELCKFARFS
jgi:hypothetical protein